MSLEQDISILTTAAGNLLALPQSIADVATGKIADLTALYDRRASSRTIQVYVDPILGLDTNVGTQAAPYKTVAGAVNKSQAGAFTVIYVSGDVTISDDVYVVNRSIMICPAGTTKTNISFERYSFVSGATTYVSVRGFKVGANAAVVLYNLNVNMPINDVPWSNYTVSSCLLFAPVSSNFGMFSVMLTSCTITFGATVLGSIMWEGWPCSYMEYGLTVIGQTSLNGYRFRNFTNTGGSTTSSLPWLVTNLTTI